MMWGADAAALSTLAAQLESRATDIERAERTLTGRLMSAPWRGPGADQYRQNWQDVDRRRLLEAAVFLRDAAGELREEAGQQVATSVADSSVRPDSFSSFDRFVAQFDDKVSWLSGGTAFITGLGVLTRAAATSGRYTNAYRPWLRLGDSMGYKSSPILQAIKSWGGAAGTKGGWVKQVNDNRFFRGLAGGLDKAGRGLDAYSIAREVVSGRDASGRSLDGGDVARRGADLTATALKSSKNPAFYLAGVGVSVWSDVVEEGIRVVEENRGTNTPLPSPFSSKGLTEVYGPAAVNTVKDIGSMMRKWF